MSDDSNSDQTNPDDFLAGGTMSEAADNLTLGESVDVDPSGVPEPSDDDTTIAP